jgi:2-haloacid dehalogenase
MVAAVRAARTRTEGADGMASSGIGSEVKALVFDTFGTVVDWRGSVIKAGAKLSREIGHDIDWTAFAEEWRRVGYHQQIAKIRAGEAPYETTDVFMMHKLEELIPKYGLKGLSDDQVQWLHKVWHRLDPWPDAVEGLTRLKKKFVIATLSNGNVALLVNMAKHGGLPWDMVLSAELVEKFKPEPEMYLSAGRLLGLPMNQVMMTAAHLRDLYASREHNMRTGFVRRPLEWGKDGPQEGEPDREKIDVVASSFVDLAEQLGA